MVDKPDESQQDTNVGEKTDAPKPSADFYKELLELPPCKLGKGCTQCNRCEH